MAKIGIFVGSSGGVTLSAAEALAELFDDAELINMEEDYDDLEQFDAFDVLLIGSSTWGQGDVQRDWVDPLYEMQNEEPDYSGKKVAFFGAGDQKSHPEEFVTALGKMKEIFSKLGADTEFGYTSTEGYSYKYSAAEKDGKFCGLAIDDINQEDLSDERIQAWASQIKKEMSL
ncbi:MAG: flavodoxin [Epsilonproteobacteria bacterium]|nr:flavodoxin [Campylobacterota bacterium]OIO15435.1 MAG: flavodoxin [Helicobacteraceae bacterium CG1_02_36_14]PIP10995.1 MAG: flavodoxin [Sulfurimonas sp. CG23_combo_of_CG06-09_8_20_14_all_36_33]PIS25803.1 MAG: flavodoxin [Sulfurimonas sp. CG08_land_8_20_14_0_20_36_33]PIU34403.1 MAG: flavodoxin [Sulfurimonas sp. CG07_land_8_20_14_0_80_36_56]PIV02745.1 MAG: flavodoxin [Sulfurimonas sp. CG03_land_8_20_14_0_80_36_25]PIV34591.1 MAG: flavodoxin [Sulfurimonas sp. CG02_land_8_20_14_3_00_36_67]PIV5